MIFTTEQKLANLGKNEFVSYFLNIYNPSKSIFFDQCSLQRIEYGSWLVKVRNIWLNILHENDPVELIFMRCLESTLF